MTFQDCNLSLNILFIKTVDVYLNKWLLFAAAADASNVTCVLTFQLIMRHFFCLSDILTSRRIISIYW